MVNDVMRGFRTRISYGADCQYSGNKILFFHFILFTPERKGAARTNSLTMVIYRCVLSVYASIWKIAIGMTFLIASRWLSTPGDADRRLAAELPMMVGGLA
jgi:hypothetical protein